MECTDPTGLANAEYLVWFSRQARRQRIPFSGTVELTTRCNLRCCHCYINSPCERTRARRELESGEWPRLFDEISRAGCLYLLMTGGEPLLRPDFPEIYRAAKEKGLLTSVFTNGTLLTAELVELFAEYAPRYVEISLYGASAETYARVTGQAQAFEWVCSGLERLAARAVPFQLKTVLLEENKADLKAMEKMARGYGVTFRFDAALIPSIHGEKHPLASRLNPRAAVEQDFRDEARVKLWREFNERYGGTRPDGKLYKCEAGLSSFFIDAAGMLSPCQMVSSISHDLRQGDFISGWRDVVPGIRDVQAPSDWPCSRCEAVSLCSYCPPQFMLENDGKCLPSSYLCAIGRYRYKNICSS